jgi:hypothetical protein
MFNKMFAYRVAAFGLFVYVTWVMTTYSQNISSVVRNKKQSFFNINLCESETYKLKTVVMVVMSLQP